MVNSNKKAFRKYWISVMPYQQSDGFFPYFVYKGVKEPELILKGKRKADSPEEVEEYFNKTLIPRLNAGPKVKKFSDTTENFLRKDKD